MTLIYLIYGLAFFSLGLAIAIYPKRDSSFRLAGQLKFIAAFGILHGVTEWLDLFILLGNDRTAAPLQIMRTLTLPASFFCLIIFGSRSLAGLGQWQKVLKVFPAIAATLWIAAVISSSKHFLTADIWSRYLIGLPGILVTAFALSRELRGSRESQIEKLRGSLRVSAIVFSFYGFFAGLIVPDADFAPANLLNYQLFLEATGIPVQIFRTLCAVFIAYAIIRALRIFDSEARESLRKAHDDLGTRVREHTVSLIETNRDLEEEITARKRIEQDLRESEEKYRSLVDSTDDSIYVVDRECRYIFMNRRHLNRLGFSEAEQISGLSFDEFHSPRTAEEFRARVDAVFKTGVSLQHEHRSERDGKYFLRTLSPIRNMRGEIIAVTVLSKDFNIQKRIEEDLVTMSLTDELTGLYNRRGFLTLADHELKLANRKKQGIFMLYADLDGLKEINDRYGHREGDKALTDTALILRETFRSSDIIARIGGDEFVVIPVEVTDTSASTIRDRLEKAIGTLNAKRKVGYTLSLSSGTAYYDPEKPVTIEDLIEEADRAMYEIKREKLQL